MENEKNEEVLNLNRDDFKDDFERIEQNIRILADLYVELSQENENLRNNLNSNLEMLISYEEEKAQHNVNMQFTCSVLMISVVFGVSIFLTIKASEFIVNKISNILFR